MIEDRNLKPGTVLVARYKKRDHRCEVVSGAEGKVAFRFGGKNYTSPSAAASAVMGGSAANGWRFWTPEGQEPARKPKAATKPAPKKRAATKAARQTAPSASTPKPKPPRAHRPTHAVTRQPPPKNGDGTNGSVKTREAIRCGHEGCGEVFPNAARAAEHAATHAAQ